MATMRGQPRAATVRDPVCGMEIDPEHAFAVRHVEGVDVHLCSADCAQSFDESPDRYLPAVERTGPGDASATPAASALERVELPITGLGRSGAGTLEQTLRAVPGIAKVHVNVQSERAFLEYDPARVTVTRLLQAIREAGFTPGEASLRLQVHGLYCAACVPRIEEALKATRGVIDATLNVATNEAKVDYLPRAVDLPALKRAVESAGPYRATEAATVTEGDHQAWEQELEYRRLMRKWWFGAIIGVFTMVLSYPYLIPGLRDWLPRGSLELRLVWA